jgi:hypothetical protein
MGFVLLAAIFLTSSGFLVGALPASTVPTAIAPAPAEAIAPVCAPGSGEDRAAWSRN